MRGLKFNAGDANLLTNILNDNNIQLDTLSFNLSNDSTIRGDALVRNLAIGTTRLDSIDIDMYQRRNALVYKILLNNRPGTLDEFAHVVANGFISDDRLSVMFKQENISGETGYRLGAHSLTYKYTVDHIVERHHEHTNHGRNTVVPEQPAQRAGSELVKIALCRVSGSLLHSACKGTTFFANFASEIATLAMIAI